MIRQLSTYRAKSEDGRNFFIRHHQRFVDAGDATAPHWIPDAEWFEIDDGARLNRLDEDRFELPSEGIVIKRLR